MIDDEYCWEPAAERLGSVQPDMTTIGTSPAGRSAPAGPRRLLLDKALHEAIHHTAEIGVLRQLYRTR